jgi:hypothetical protein
VAGWFHVASLAARLGRGPEDWEVVLVACDEIEQLFSEQESSEDYMSSVNWYRGQALYHLDRSAEALPLLQELASGGDTWALSARQLLSSKDFVKNAKALMVRPSDQ